MFDALIEVVEHDLSIRYRLMNDGVPVSYSRVLELWATASGFRTYFTGLLTDSPFTAYRWETPGLTRATAGQPFEFVLLNSPGFTSRRTDAETYDSHFTDDDTDRGVVSFPNLRGDATLVVPSPRGDNHQTHGHLAAFVRGAPESQVDALWRVVGNTVQGQLGDKPIWLSTAGGGVAWLHVRLDSRPKYYHHAPYRHTT